MLLSLPTPENNATPNTTNNDNSTETIATDNNNNNNNNNTSNEQEPISSSDTADVNQAGAQLAAELKALRESDTELKKEVCCVGIDIKLFKFIYIL